MKLTAIALAVLVAPLIQAAPAPVSELEARQAEPRVLIDPALWPVLQRYTRFAAASYATFLFNFGNCPSPPFGAKLIQAIQSPTTSAQVAIFRDTVAKEIIIAFAGTDTLEDIGTDVNYFLTPFTTAPGCDNCQVHNGVLLGWRSLQPSLMAALKNLVADSPGYTTVIVGHSLGGGLASIAFTDLRSNGVPIAKTYTMGSLRVGNPAYADYTDRLSGASNTNLGDLLRMTHGIDGVPNLPTQAMGFRHTRTEIYEVDNASGAESPQTTYRCFGQEAPDCNLSTTTGIINQDHLTYTGIFMASGAQCYSSD